MGTEETRWLDEAEAEAWMPLVATVMRLPPALDAQLVRDAGLSHFEYCVLAALSEREDRALRLSELARMANSTLSRLSKVLNRLAEQGWVTRRPDPDDRRTTWAVLSDAGMQKVAATAPGHVARVRELVFDHLTRAEVRQLAAIARKLSAVVDPAVVDPAGIRAGRIG